MFGGRGMKMTRWVGLILGILLISMIFSLVGEVSPAQADTGSYTINNSGALPTEYVPTIPFPENTFIPEIGRLDPLDPNPIPSALYDPGGESLNPQNMALGQIVPMEYLITTTADDISADGDLCFTAYYSYKTTNQGDFGFDETVQAKDGFGVLTAFVDPSDPSHVEVGTLDAYVSSLSTAITAVNPNYLIEATICVADLEPNEDVVVEVWPVLDKTLPPGGVGGNVPSGLLEAWITMGTEDPSDDDYFSPGGRTIPLKQVAEFENADIDVALVKADGDQPKLPGQTFDYAIEVSVTEEDLVANGVVVTDVLDPYLDIVLPWTETSYSIDPPLSTRTCTYDDINHEVVCDLVAVAYDEPVTITFPVYVPYDTPKDSNLEYDGVEVFGIVYPEITCGIGDDGDVCNHACVTTTISDDPNTTNNCDDEPKNILIPTVVELGEFTAEGQVRAVQLNWTTVDQTNLTQFNLYRDRTSKGKNKELVESFVLSPSGVYEYTDLNLNPGPYYYWLEAVGNGTSKMYGPEIAWVFANDKALNKVK